MKFDEMETTETGDPRAFVRLKALETLWFNTGSLCNLECNNCYIESSPRNDRLSYIDESDVKKYLDEIKLNNLNTQKIGFTGGEPFLNPSIIELLELSLSNNFKTLVLTNAYRVLNKHKKSLLELNSKYGELLSIRVSLDHFTSEIHEAERGVGSFKGTLESIIWLFDNGFNFTIASRSLKNESQKESIEGHQKLFEEIGIVFDCEERLIIFPEMNSGKEMPEISVHCWDILNKTPEQQMCSSERMIVKPKAYNHTRVMPCTLIAYDERFVLGNSLAESKNKVYLNHPFCAEFCVLGGASCSS